MSTKPSSLPTAPKPTPPSSASSTAQNRRPKKLPNAASEGGVMLPPTPSSTSPQNQPQPQSTDSTSAQGPNRRRRPRKLNKEPLTETTSSTSKQEKEGVGTELEALKSRVRGLEAKVEELYKSGTGATAKSPRKRGKGRKASTPAPGAAQDSVPKANADEKEEADGEPDPAELARLEDELALARLDLATLSSNANPRPTRPRASRVASAETDDVEEVPRGSIPSASDRPRGGRSNTNSSTNPPNDRAVTLTGSYRIPLPQSVNIDDVRSIQSGITSAQAVARSFLDSRRETATTRPAPPRRSSSSAAGGGGRGGGEGEKEGQSWGEWFGAYSMSISRAVKKIEAEAAVEVESQGPPRNARPIQGPRRASAPGKPPPAAAAGAGAKKGAAGAGPKAATPKAAAGGAGGTGKGVAAKRPPLNPRTSNSGTPSRVSAEQVKTLLS